MPDIITNIKVGFEEDSVNRILNRLSVASNAITADTERKLSYYRVNAMRSLQIAENVIRLSGANVDLAGVINAINVTQSEIGIARMLGESAAQAAIGNYMSAATLIGLAVTQQGLLIQQQQQKAEIAQAKAMSDSIRQYTAIHGSD